MPCHAEHTFEHPYGGRRIHDLKTWPEPFEMIWQGLKTAELRYNDRRFLMGDYLNLKEYNPETKTYSGREIMVQVTHILNAEDLIGKGLMQGFVMLSFKTIKTGFKTPGMFTTEDLFNTILSQ